MITEDYVSYETAKLLKEKGFEYNLDESYWLIDADNKMYWVSRIGAYDYVDIPTESFQRPKNGYRLITQATAMKWLREVHHIFINIDYDPHEFGDKPYFTLITNMDTCSYYSGKHLPVNRATYEEMAEAAIKYCIENLI